MPTKSDRLFEYQSSIIQQNRYALDLKALKNEGVARSTTAILSSVPTTTSTSPSINSISVLNAAARTRSDNNKAALKDILPLLEKRPADVGLLLIVIQLYVLTNNSGAAVQLLESFFKRLEESSSSTDQDVRFAPGLVALAVSLYRSQGRIATIKAELGKAASYWRRKSQPSESLYRAAGVALLDSSNPQDLQEASEIFSTLRKQDPTDKLAVAGYVVSKAHSDFASIKADADKLTPVDRLIAGIDISALEAGGIATLPVVMSEASKKRAAPAEKVKPTKKRKSKLPKDYEEGKVPDPERWLPLKDRSSYRPKGKKGKKKAMDSTQGGVVKEEDLAVAPVKAEVVQAQAGQNKKKKKGKK